MSATTNANGSVTAVDGNSFPPIVELNVGGVFYTTSLGTLTKEPDSLLGHMFTGRSSTPALRDSKGKYFLDRDGVLFRYILDYLRNQKMILPENFHEKERLKHEAEYFKLQNMVRSLNSTQIVHTTRSHVGLPALTSASGEALKPGFITVGYRGTFAFGRDGLADVKFRKLSRILVCGKVTLCREVFGETLNESRDPDRGLSDRYTSRFFLKHNFLEQAFDMLAEGGFRCVSGCASSTNNGGELKPGMDSEENRWNHYNEFVFQR